MTVPDTGDRYLSVMVVNQDHYINRVIHDPGDHPLTVDEFDTPYVRGRGALLVDPADPADVAAVNTLQDQFALTPGRGAVRDARLRPSQLRRDPQRAARAGQGLRGFDHAFGSKAEVDPVRHLIGTAAGWGGLPDDEAFYVNVEPGLPVGEYRLTVGDVPVDAFWSISVYNADGFFEPNDRNAYSVNSVTATRNEDGSVTVHFGGCDDNRPNCLPIMDGWNYLVRLYRPRPEVLDGSWTFPTIDDA